jgi:hypothetical protein
MQTYSGIAPSASIGAYLAPRGQGGWEDNSPIQNLRSNGLLPTPTSANLTLAVCR